MQLIKKVEIKYLRSLYNLSLVNVGDMNVIFGRNDSGKSNFLRALNLFFNKQTEPSQKFDFRIDMSDQRKQEAREVKGKQFMWIKVTFTIPKNYQNSLGKELTIKKQWNRDGEVNQTTMGKPEINPGRLTRFLNDIDFTYIPAIKDTTVFADLIERMYGAAADSQELSSAANNFVKAIGGQASTLTLQLSQMFGGETKLALPTDMQKLFRNLDFSHGDDNHSLLRQKGDGVKARHLPELLRFINENESRNKFYLWGFEEPENSLDLGAAEIEAQRFATFAERNDTQVFITSHSPAFYLANLSGKAKVKRYFITKQEKNGPKKAMTPVNAAAPIDNLDDAENKMKQAGLLQLPFIIRKMDAQRSEIQRLSKDAKALRADLDAIETPTLYVEGQHDVNLFMDAFKRLKVCDKIPIKPLGGTPDTTSSLIKAVLEQGGLSARSKAFFLFDNDQAGRSAYKNLQNKMPCETPEELNENIHVWVLQESQEHLDFLKRNKIPIDKSFFTAEFLLSSGETSKICEELVSQAPNGRFDHWKACIHQSYHDTLPQHTSVKLNQAKAGTPDWFFARGIPKTLKAQFALRVKEKNLNTELIDAISKTIVNIMQ